MTFGRHHMFTALLGKPNRLFHQNRSQDSTLISVLLNAVSTVPHWYSRFLFFETYRVTTTKHITRWLIYVSCSPNFVVWKCWENCRTYINSLLNWTPALRTSNPLADICSDIRGRERGGGVREKFAKICVQPLLHKSLTIKQPKKVHKQTTQ